MTKKSSLILGFAATLVLIAGTSARATITGISADGCGGTTCLPSFVAPIVAGKQMTVTVKGQYLDLSTGVEVSGAGVHASYGDRSGGSNTYIVVRFDVDASAALGERTVKIRYAIETNGPDTFKVQVVRGGRVDRIEQKVPGLIAGTTRLIATDAIAVNQRITLVFTGTRLGNGAIAPIQAIKNPQTLSGCSETRCEVELEFTRTGTLDVNLYDADIGSAGVLAINGSLHKFFYDGAKQVVVVGTSSSPTTNVPHPILSSSGGTNTLFVDVAPGANLGNLFRGTGNSVTVDGSIYLQVDDHWCQDNAVQTPSSLSPPNFKDVTIPNLIWKVSNVGTAEITVGFDSQLLSNGAVFQTQNIVAGTLTPGATRDFTFHRTNSGVRLFRLAPPNQSGCFIRKPGTGFALTFEDPQFTVSVDVRHATGETQNNQSNNSRSY